MLREVGQLRVASSEGRAPSPEPWCDPGAWPGRRTGLTPQAGGSALESRSRSRRLRRRHHLLPPPAPPNHSSGTGTDAADSQHVGRGGRRYLREGNTERSRADEEPQWRPPWPLSPDADRGSRSGERDGFSSGRGKRVCQKLLPRAFARPEAPASSKLLHFRRGRAAAALPPTGVRKGPERQAPASSRASTATSRPSFPGPVPNGPAA